MTVDSIEKTSSGFSCFVLHNDRYTKGSTHRTMLFIATGYYGQPNKLEIEGGSLPHVSPILKKPTLIFIGVLP